MATCGREGRVERRSNGRSIERTQRGVKKEKEREENARGRRDATLVGKDRRRASRARGGGDGAEARTDHVRGRGARAKARTSRVGSRARGGVECKSSERSVRAVEAMGMGGGVNGRKKRPGRSTTMVMRRAAVST